MATGGSAIRGTRVGSGPMGEQDRGIQADRIAVSYWDAMGNGANARRWCEIRAREALYCTSSLVGNRDQYHHVCAELVCSNRYRQEST